MLTPGSLFIIVVFYVSLWGFHFPFSWLTDLASPFLPAERPVIYFVSQCSFLADLLVTYSAETDAFYLYIFFPLFPVFSLWLLLVMVKFLASPLSFLIQFLLTLFSHLDLFFFFSTSRPPVVEPNFFPLLCMILQFFSFKLWRLKWHITRQLLPSLSHTLPLISSSHVSFFSASALFHILLLAMYKGTAYMQKRSRQMQDWQTRIICLKWLEYTRWSLIPQENTVLGD